MKCPRDHTSLNRNIKQQVFGDCCNECDGVFLSGEGMNLFKTNCNTKVLEKTILFSEKETSKLVCPHCEITMSLTNIDDIEIDYCPKCLGVWFDKSEAVNLIEKYNPQNPPQSIFMEFLDIVIWLPLCLGTIYTIFLGN